MPKSKYEVGRIRIWLSPGKKKRKKECISALVHSFTITVTPIHQKHNAITKQCHNAKCYHSALCINEQAAAQGFQGFIELLGFIAGILKLNKLSVAHTLPSTRHLWSLFSEWTTMTLLFRYTSGPMCMTNNGSTDNVQEEFYSDVWRRLKGHNP